MPATKRRPKTARRAKGQDAGCQLPCSYGGVSYGDKTCRLGVSVSLGNLIPTDAVPLLVGKRLKVLCTAIIGRADQPALTGEPSHEELQVAGTADVKGIGVTTKAITFGLTFPIEGFDGEHSLPQFAKREGFVRVLDAEDIPEEAARLPGGDDEEAAEAD